MKKILTGLLALMMIATASQAQDIHGKKRHHKHHGKHMMEQKLNFSEQQKKELKDINAGFRNQMSELKKQDNITVKEFRSRKESLGKEHKEKLQGLLTAEQKSQMEKMKQERMAKAKSHRKAAMDQVKSKLNLSNEQVSKLKTSREAFTAKVKEIRSNESLTNEQKKKQVKALAQQQKEETKSILTTEQIEKLEQMHKEHRARSAR